MAFYMSLSSNPAAGTEVLETEFVENSVRLVIARAGAPTFDTAETATKDIRPDYVGEVRTFKVTVELVGSEVRGVN